MLAYRLAQKPPRMSARCVGQRGRTYVHVTFVIMLPITIKTGDP